MPHNYDGGKKVSGRKRHLLVDTMGQLLKVIVHAANHQDRESVNLRFQPTKVQFPRMEKVGVDEGSTGKGKTWIETQMDWTVARRGVVHAAGLDHVRRPGASMVDVAQDL